MSAAAAADDDDVSGSEDAPHVDWLVPIGWNDQIQGKRAVADAAEAAKVFAASVAAADAAAAAAAENAAAAFEGSNVLLSLEDLDSIYQQFQSQRDIMSRE
jgi:hypothetical protein